VYLSGGTQCESAVSRFINPGLSSPASMAVDVISAARASMAVDVISAARACLGAVGPGHRPSGQTDSCCVRTVFDRLVTSVDSEMCA